MALVLAIDLGGTKTAVGLVDQDGRLLDKETAPSALGDPGAAVALVLRLAGEVTARSGRARSAGMALPGLVDEDRGVLLQSPSSGWRDVPFAAMASAALGLPVVAANDVNACALAEARFGSGRGLSSFFWMQVSTGIGGAVFAGGEVLRGATGMAGEIGHLVVREGGAPCGCGNRGCLEAEAAGPAWRRYALELLGSEGRGTEDLDARRIAELARGGDPVCARVVAQVAAALARGVAAVVNILDPEALIFGGGVAAALDLLLPGMLRELPSLVIGGRERRVEIRPSSLGYDAALVGAAALAMDGKRTPAKG